MREPRALTVVAGLAMLILAGSAQAQTSYQSTRLNDVIKSSGAGDINLMVAGNGSKQLNPTPAALEWFRVNNDGGLVFAVDINENASGTEKASSQGVSIKSAKVVAVIGGTTYEFTEFSTRTQASLAEGSNTTRGMRYTMIGDTGSNRITSNTESDIYASDFDATLRVEVGRSLATATSVRLQVNLLNTNVALGDPEAFYDYTNGFEDIAIVTASDAAFLDGIKAGQSEAPMVIQTSEIELLPTNTLYLPAVDKYYIVAYEDQFPNRGDYDFNDLVVGYRVYMELNNSNKVVGIGGIGYLVARGGGFDHDWFLKLNLPANASGSYDLTLYDPPAESTLPEAVVLVPMSGYPLTNVPNSGPLNMLIFRNTSSLWVDPGHNFVNTERDQSLINGYRFSFHYRPSNPMSMSSMPTPPYDPYLYVYNTQYEIHLEGNSLTHPDSKNAAHGLSGFRDASNYPYAMLLPEEWLTPIEYIDLGEAYPEFLEFVRSNGGNKQDWYNRPNSNAIKNNPPSKWKW